MKRAKEKGVSLVSLVITIIVLLIIVSTTVYRIGSFTSTSRFNNMKADIELLHDKILTYRKQYEKLPIVEPVLPVQIVTQVLSEQKAENDNDEYYKIDLTKLENITLNYGNESEGESDYYIVNTRTLNVYYLKGIELNQTVYHVGEKYEGSITPNTDE